jgi:hypothetical protein
MHTDVIKMFPDEAVYSGVLESHCSYQAMIRGTLYVQYVDCVKVPSKQ